MGDQGKISLAEAVLMLMITGAADLLEFLLTFAVGVGEIVKWFIDIPTWFIIQFWLMIKGVRGTWFLAGSLLELIPVINALPIRTLTMVITIYLANKPQSSALVAEATKVAQRVIPKK